MQWFTVVAQIINFLVLVVLLKWLLFDRIVRAMDQRQKRIADQLEEAARNKKEAENELEAFRERNRQFDAQRRDMLTEAKGQAEHEHKQLLEQAKSEVGQLRVQWKEALKQQERELLQEIEQQAAQGFRQVARSALAELADTELEHQTVHVFLKRLEGLQPDERTAMEGAIAASNDRLAIATARELGEGLRGEVVRALRERFGQELQVTFETRPDLVCGIQLLAGGQAIGWNFSSYLEALSERVRETIAHETHELGPDEGQQS
jgi:F-type H+-transporting ATPase subunit b